MTGDDAYTILCALAGDNSEEFVRLFDIDYATAGDLAALVTTQRKENEHLRSQLRAASEHVELMRHKRAYLRDGWLREDLATLERLLALVLAGPLEELRKMREREGLPEVKP